MKKYFVALIFIVLVVGVGAAYTKRTDLYDWWIRSKQPELPAPRSYQPAAGGVTTVSSGESSQVEGGVAESENFALVSSPPQVAKPRSVDPFDETNPLPDAVNLDVPFTSQAPLGDWAMPYQEACEEASVLMVNGFYQNLHGVIDPQSAKKQLDDIVAIEKSILGKYEDTTAKETAAFIQAAYPNRYDVIIRPLTSAKEIQRVVANGFPVIIPAAGKQLPNPFFRNGGPPYHMLVIKGYAKGYFITNDPGTKRGADFSYSFGTMLKAAHDWDPVNVNAGPAVMLVMVPKI